MQSFTIHDLPLSERPRERLQQYNAEALSSQELLALVLGRGIKGESVMMIAQQLLSRFGSLRNVVEASLEDLQSQRGLGLAKASQLKACFEMARRLEVREERREKGRSFVSPERVYGLVKSKIRTYAKEHFIVLSFDVRNKLLGVDTVSVGILNQSIIHPRETFEAAIKRHASHIIVAHNHPSDDPEPSGEDREVTRRLVEGGRLLGIELVDHIIVTHNTYMSFKERHLL